MNVYRLDKTGRLSVAADGINVPDGLAFSPDERTLYIIEDASKPPAIRAYDVVDDVTREPTVACSSAKRAVETACASMWTAICGAGGQAGPYT